MNQPAPGGGTKLADYQARSAAQLTFAKDSNVTISDGVVTVANMDPNEIVVIEVDN